MNRSKWKTLGKAEKKKKEKKGSKNFFCKFAFISIRIRQQSSWSWKYLTSDLISFRLVLLTGYVKYSKAEIWQNCKIDNSHVRSDKQRQLNHNKSCLNSSKTTSINWWTNLASTLAKSVHNTETPNLLKIRIYQSDRCGVKWVDCIIQLTKSEFHQASCILRMVRYFVHTRTASIIIKTVFISSLAFILCTCI